MPYWKDEEVSVDVFIGRWNNLETEQQEVLCQDKTAATSIAQCMFASGIFDKDKNPKGISLSHSVGLILSGRDKSSLKKQLTAAIDDLKNNEHIKQERKWLNTVSTNLANGIRINLQHSPYQKHLNHASSCLERCETSSLFSDKELTEYKSIYRTFSNYHSEEVQNRLLQPARTAFTELQSSDLLQAEREYQLQLKKQPLLTVIERCTEGPLQQQLSKAAFALKQLKKCGLSSTEINSLETTLSEYQEIGYDLMKPPAKYPNSNTTSAGAGAGADETKCDGSPTRYRERICTTYLQHTTKGEAEEATTPQRRQ